MEIFLLRHGIAEDPRSGMSDPERALTREGRDKLKRVLKRAQEAGVAPTLILSSPYRRAIETAEIAAESLAYKGEIVHTQALLPNASPADTWNQIRTHNGEDTILLASHEPLMSALLAHLLNSPALRTDFKKGALARLEAESTGPAPRCALKWLLTPALA
jgi:phosphohistidine phosphatase